MPGPRGWRAQAGARPTREPPRGRGERSRKLPALQPSTGPSPGLGAVHQGPEGYRTAYVNEVGAATLKGDGPYDYPVGTVIVKEQYPDRAAFESGEGAEVTVSLKIDDAEDGGAANWHWATGYKDRAGENAFCSGCHSIPIAEDLVFSNAKYLAEIEGR